MWFESKRALRQRDELAALHARCDAQAARIAALELSLAAAEEANRCGQRQLDYYRGVSANLIRFSHSVAHLGDSFEHLSGQLEENRARAERVATAALDNQTAFEVTDAILKLTAGVNILAHMNGQEEMATLQAVAGCLDIDDDDMDSEGIIGRCSTALNVARYEKHVPWLFSTPEMHSKAIRQKQILSVFADALAAGEFKPYYQPKVNTKTRTLVGAEALVRWERHGAVIAPGEFIPVLETGDSICVLDFYIFEQVCKDLRRWIDEGIDPVRISTNFSRRNLADPEFSEKIRKILSKYNIPKAFIEVEVTETISEEENDRLSRFIREMHDSSIAMAIDDFGTGYSSLNLLRDFSADVLKLDKSFIDGHTGTKRDSVVVSNVAKMASELDMSVITEGVEKEEQVEFLKSVNIDLVQGYLFDKPLPKAAFEQRLKKKVYD